MNIPITKEWQEKMETIMLRRGWNQAELARRLNVGSHSTVARWISGETKSLRSRDARVIEALYKEVAHEPATASGEVREGAAEDAAQIPYSVRRQQSGDRIHVFVQGAEVHLHVHGEGIDISQ